MAVHPRRRGEHHPLGAPVVCRTGSSPQARGTLKHAKVSVDTDRFIPAGAGNTLRSAREWSQRAVHPRRRGEHDARSSIPDFLSGSSPQARGTHRRCCGIPGRCRFIPAGAGNTPWLACCLISVTVHPRRRGEHALIDVSVFLISGSSPQARGTQSHLQPGGMSLRFIPAGAGNTISRC